LDGPLEHHCNLIFIEQSQREGRGGVEEERRQNIPGPWGRLIVTSDKKIPTNFKALQ